MTDFKYLIAGGGMAADAALRGIRELDADAPVGIIGWEPDPPYTRPMLSKGLWKGKAFEKVWRGTEKLNPELILGRGAVKLDPQKKIVTDDMGEKYGYEKLLIATGGTPNRLQFGDSEIIYFRSLQDYQRLRALADQHQRFLVIGGSFIGSEIAAALTMVGRRAAIVFRGPAIAHNIFPADLAQHLNKYYEEKGVEVAAGEEPISMEGSNGAYIVRTKSGRTFEVDAVVAGIGISPNVDLAKSGGLSVEDGIVVDGQLRTSAADVYAAGDVASFIHPALKERTRVEHEDNALRMGKLAGRNMAGAGESYTHVPMFYSDMFDLGYEAVGDLSSKLQTFVDWQEPFKKGVIYYLDGGRVRGVLLWNVWEKLGEARALLGEPGPLAEDDLKGRIKG